MIYNIFPKQGNYVGSFLGHCATSNDETYLLPLMLSYLMERCKKEPFSPPQKKKNIFNKETNMRKNPSQNFAGQMQ